MSQPPPHRPPKVRDELWAILSLVASFRTFEWANACWDAKQVGSALAWDALTLLFLLVGTHLAIRNVSADE